MKTIRFRSMDGFCSFEKAKNIQKYTDIYIQYWQRFGETEAIGRNRKLCDISGKKCDLATPSVDVYITYIFQYVHHSTDKKAQVDRMYKSKDLKPLRWI